MNNIKLKAFRQTVGFFAIVAIVATLIVYLASIISPQVMTWIIISTLFAGGFYLMYSFNLSRLELEERFPDDK